MTRKHVRAAAKKLVAQLPEFPWPWDIEVLCRTLEEQRSRPLILHPVNIPAMPSGMWYDNGSEDHIFYRESASGYYRDHIILHEICHILLGHGQERTGIVAGQTAHGCTRNNAEEQLAEAFSSMVLKAARQLQGMGPSAVERRVGELFGTASEVARA